MDRESYTLRQNKEALNNLLPLLENKLKDLKTKADSSEINIIRNQIQQQCLKMADTPTGFYSFDCTHWWRQDIVLTSLGYKTCNKEWTEESYHPLYLTQVLLFSMASVLRSIFGEENVLGTS